MCDFGEKKVSREKGVMEKKELFNYKFQVLSNFVKLKLLIFS